MGTHDEAPVGVRDSEGGLAARHRQRASLPVYAAPTHAQGLNTVRAPLAAVACWRIDDPRFEFDSSFIKPVAAAEFSAFASLAADLGEAPVTLFGHADPVGDTAYNKTLSGRRAAAVYAVLTRDADLWEALYSKPFGGDSWSSRAAVSTMLAALGYGPGFSETKRFQSEHGLAPDGAIGPLSRKQLFLAYMDALCRDSSGAPFVLARERFLAKGQGPQGKGDYQGCGERNPVMVFSSEEDARYRKPANKPERDLANATNRRVVAFFFAPGTELPAGMWPCPRADEPDAGCKPMLWPDADARVAPREKRREYAHSHDTVSCRWYDGLSRGSPCEAARETLSITLLDDAGDPVAGAPYRLWFTGGPGLTRPDRVGTTNAQGRIVEPNVLSPARCHVEWTTPKHVARDPAALEAGYPYARLLYLNHDDADDEDEQARRRLANLGYPLQHGLDEAVALFQSEYRVAHTGARGELDGATRARLREVHDEGRSRDG